MGVLIISQVDNEDFGPIGRYNFFVN